MSEELPLPFLHHFSYSWKAHHLFLPLLTCSESSNLHYFTPPPFIFYSLSICVCMLSIGICYKNVFYVPLGILDEAEDHHSWGNLVLSYTWKENMALLETLSSTELFNFIVYDTISATPFLNHDSSSEATFLVENRVKPQEHDPALFNDQSSSRKRHSDEPQVQGRKKRRRKPRVCKNKEEAETQRMTHIAVERNRRKQMNEHLAVLRSLMPESYVQRVSMPFIFFSFFF